MSINRNTCLWSPEAPTLHKENKKTKGKHREGLSQFQGPRSWVSFSTLSSVHSVPFCCVFSMFLVNFFLTLPLHHLSSHPFYRQERWGVGVWVCVYAKACPPPCPPPLTHTHTYDTHVSMPRCFMAKKLKYPYQEWKERQDPVDTGGSRSHYVTPETDQRATTENSLSLIFFATFKVFMNIFATEKSRAFMFCFAKSCWILLPFFLLFFFNFLKLYFESLYKEFLWTKMSYLVLLWSDSLPLWSLICAWSFKPVCVQLHATLSEEISTTIRGVPQYETMIAQK